MLKKEIWEGGLKVFYVDKFGRSEYLTTIYYKSHSFYQLTVLNKLAQCVPQSYAHYKKSFEVQRFPVF